MTEPRQTITPVARAKLAAIRGDFLAMSESESLALVVAIRAKRMRPAVKAKPLKEPKPPKEPKARKPRSKKNAASTQECPPQPQATAAPE